MGRCGLVGEAIAAVPLDKHRHEVTHRSAVEFGVLAIDRALYVLCGQLRKLFASRAAT